MFFGGGLISHLSGEDDATSEFVKLQKLNRNMAILMDTDKATAHSNLKPATARIKAEFAKSGGVVWITKGREIENYVEPALLHEAIKSVHPTIYSRPSRTGIFDNSFHFIRKKTPKHPAAVYTATNKVGVAKYVCGKNADLTLLDLKLRVGQIVKMIQEADK